MAHHGVGPARVGDSDRVACEAAAALLHRARLHQVGNHLNIKGDKELSRERERERNINRQIDREIDRERERERKREREKERKRQRWIDR